MICILVQIAKSPPRRSVARSLISRSGGDMKHLKLLGMMAALLALCLNVSADDKKADDKKPHDEHGGAFMECARACDDCARSCDACGAHCAKLLADGKKEHLKTLQTCQDCATTCSAASCIVARHGPFSDAI